MDWKDKAPRSWPDDIEGVIRHFGHRARVVVLWRQDDEWQSRWAYIERIDPDECRLETIKATFGGGWYRAKIYGGWNPQSHGEEYLEQVSFGIAGNPTALTGQAIARARVKWGLPAR